MYAVHFLSTPLKLARTTLLPWLENWLLNITSILLGMIMMLWLCF